MKGYMENFFDKYELYTEGDSIYYYKGTKVLKNKFGLKDIETLKEAEAEIVFSALLELEINPVQGNFNKDHLYKIHKFLFGDLYDFAGKTRQEDIAKGKTKFCIYNFIDEQLEILFEKIKEVDINDLDSKEKVSDYITYIMAELNIIHPFREGNGRAIREFVRELSKKLGYNLDWNKTDKEELLDAMVKSVFDSSDLRKCLNKVLN